MEKRPDFETLASYEEFKKYYWYRKELSGICRKLGIEYRGTKQELNHHIEEYFCGKLAERKGVPRLSKKVSDIELHTPLLDCGFSFFARHKLTDDFPDNLDTLDLPLDYSYFKKRETRLSGGVITNGKKEIPIRDIRRVKCITNGTISNLCIYTTDKGRFFFDMPKMTVTLNALTVPLLEAVMTRNTGHGIDFSRGDGFGQSTSEFVIIRYLDSGYFLHKDGTAHEDWQKTACDRTAGYGYDLKMLLQE